MPIISGTTMLVIGGVSVVAALIGKISQRKKTKQIEEIQKTIYEIQRNLDDYYYAKDNYDTLKRKLNSAIDYLNDSQKSFESGGHVQDGVPLAQDTFKMIVGNLNTSLNNIDKILYDLNSAILSLEAELKECNSLITELSS